MQLAQLLALAAPASAFLVLPEMAPPSGDEGAFRILPVEELNPLAVPSTASSQTISIPCRECHGKDASVKFDIEVKDMTRLVINGFEGYPANSQDGQALTASVSSMEGSEGAKEDLGYVVWWKVMEVDQEQGMKILDWHLAVESVGATPVSGVGIGMTLIIGPNNEILIADVAIPEEKPACDGLLCSIQEMWEELWAGSMGCHDAIRPDMVVEVPSELEHEDWVYVEDEDWEEDWNMIKNLAAHVILPVIMGITAGVGSAVVVMFICSLVAFSVRKLSGHEERYSFTLVPSQVVVIEEDSEEDEEKKGLMNGQAPPPAYEAPVEKE